MIRSFGLVVLLTSVPVVCAARDPRLEQTVFLRPGAVAKVDGVVVDIATIPGSPPGPRIEKIEGDLLWLQTAWVHKKDVMNAREAVEYYTEQVRLKPHDASLWRILGTAWSHANVQGENEVHDLKCFSEAIRLDPNDANTFFARGELLAYNSKNDEAIQDFSDAIRLKPNIANFYNKRGMARRWKGEIDEQISDYSEAIKLDPSNMSYLHNRAYTYKGKGDIDYFLEDYAEIIRRGETSDSEDDHLYSFAMNAVAFIRATWPDERYRDGKLAVDHALKACAIRAKSFKENECSDAGYLATLAAAYAEVGDFANAVKWGKKALKFAKDGGPEWMRDESIKSAKDCLELYQAKKPFRDAGTYNEIAWLKATCSRDQYRDGKKALEMATRACELTDWKNWQFIDTLSAAYAETSDFARAIQWQTKAIEMAPEKEKEPLRVRLKLYQGNKPYRELRPV
jgi:tetratricopeptide (TPR) repeat protein